MVLTDQSLLETTAVTTSLQSLRDEGIECVVFADVSVEPTDASFADAIKFAVQGAFDGYVAVGGGSVMDTAKAANLYDSYPADFLEYVNAPIGKGTPVPGALKPLIAVPTTAGTGSETSGSGDLRHAGDAREDGNRQSSVEAAHGIGGSGKH